MLSRQFSHGLNLNDVIVPQQRNQVLKTMTFLKENLQFQKFQVLEQIIGNDDRYRIRNINQYPYQNIGFLISKYQTTDTSRTLIGNGTAILVASNVLLTCAHNIFNKNLGKEAFQIQFFPGLDGNKYFSQRIIKAKKPFLYSENYLISKTSTADQRDNDWAFLILDKHIQAVQTLPIIVDCPDSNKLIGIYGYSQDKIKQDYQNCYIYGMTGTYKLRIEENEQKQQIITITYQIDTNFGQSGSAILIYLKDSIKAIIGIHTVGVTNGEFNIGCRLTSIKMNLANTWIKQNFPEQNLISYFNLDDSIGS